MRYSLVILNHHQSLLLSCPLATTIISWDRSIYWSCNLRIWFRERDWLGYFMLRNSRLHLQETIQRGHWWIFLAKYLSRYFFLNQVWRVTAGTSLSQETLAEVRLRYSCTSSSESLVSLMSLSVSAHPIFRSEIYRALLFIHLNQLMKVYSLVS